MTHDRQEQRRSHFAADSDDVSVREGEDDGDGLFRIRMPVSSTSEARDGEAFERDRLDGFARQIESGDIGVFLDHGRSGVAESRYSALGKVGYWDSPDVADRDAGADLVADAVLMDPAELDATVGDVREALATLKAQAEMGVPLASSVGWSEDTGDRDTPGDADLLEISIVGIPSDPRTTTASAEPVPVARAVSAASSDFDVATFVRELRAQTARAEYEVGDETLDITPPEAMQTAATLSLAKADELDPDCGTGVGTDRAGQIADDEVGPDVVEEVAAYLTSHEEDVTADGPPSDWSDEEWADCGNLQYAKWGGTGTGTGLEWAQERANAVAEARDEELPYPDRGVTATDAHAPADTADTADTADEERDDTMTDSDTESESVDEESADADRDEQPALRAMEDKMDEMREQMEENTRMTGEIHEEMVDRQEGDDEDGDEDEDGDDENPEDEESADTAPDGEESADDPQTVTIDGEERAVGDALEDLRAQADAAETEDLDPKTTDHGDEDDAVDDRADDFDWRA